MQTNDTVGFIGLGVMGRPMARHLLDKGFPLVVHNRSQGAGGRARRGGRRRAPARRAEVAPGATRIITMLPDTPDVERVLTGPTASSPRCSAARS